MPVVVSWDSLRRVEAADRGQREGLTVKATALLNPVKKQAYTEIDEHCLVSTALSRYVARERSVEDRGGGDGAGGGRESVDESTMGAVSAMVARVCLSCQGGRSVTPTIDTKLSYTQDV
jgi:hypothetical protein